MNGECLTDLGIEVLQNAKRLYLEKHPLATTEQLGLYAYLSHQRIPSPACCFYYLDRKHRLLEREILYSGITLPVEECCAHLEQTIRVRQAAYAVVSMARSHTGLEGEDLDRASRIALFCRAQGIPLLEILWVDAEGYLPVCRYFGQDE